MMKPVDRREFLISLSTALAGMGLASSQSQPAQTGMELLGQGTYQWKVVPGWGVLDGETPVKNCHAMVQTKDGRIFLLTDHTKNNVVIYDRSGKLLGKWGTEYPGAHGFTLAVENGVEVFYLTDHDRHQFYKLSLSGEVLRTWDFPVQSGKYQSAAEFKPTHVALAPEGGFFVVDGYGKNWCHRYDAKGEYVKSFGGNEPGGAHLDCAHGAWVDTRDEKNLIWITSRKEAKVKRYTQEGVLVDTIELPAGQPNFIVPFGELTMIPHLNGFITILGPDLKIVSNLAAKEPDYADGKLLPVEINSKVFTHPHGLLIADDESIYISQWNSKNTYPIKLERV